MKLFGKSKKAASEYGEFKTSTGVKDIFDGKKMREIVVNNLSYIVFLIVLTFFYIGNRYSCEKTLRQINQAEKELKELRYEYITHASELMSISRMSEVSRMVREKGLELEESREPAKRLKLD